MMGQSAFGDVIGYETFDQVFDNRECGVIGWELREVIGGFEGDHVYGPP